MSRARPAGTLKELAPCGALASTRPSTAVPGPTRSPFPTCGLTATRAHLRIASGDHACEESARSFLAPVDANQRATKAFAFIEPAQVFRHAWKRDKGQDKRLLYRTPLVCGTPSTFAACRRNTAPQGLGPGCRHSAVAAVGRAHNRIRPSLPIISRLTIMHRTGPTAGHAVPSSPGVPATARRCQSRCQFHREPGDDEMNNTPPPPAGSSSAPALAWVPYQPPPAPARPVPARAPTLPC